MLRKKKRKKKKEKNDVYENENLVGFENCLFFTKKKKTTKRSDFESADIFSSFFGMFRTVEIINANIRRKYRFMKIKFFENIDFAFPGNFHAWIHIQR